MTTLAAPMTTLMAAATPGRVPLPFPSVNRLLPMTTRGERLRRYLAAKTGGRRGWQAELVEKSGVKRQTITKWTHPDFDRYPDLEALAQVASALGVPTAEIVAALDGDAPAGDVSPDLQLLIREQIEAVLDERLGPRRGSHE